MAEAGKEYRVQSTEYSVRRTEFAAADLRRGSGDLGGGDEIATPVGGSSWRATRAENGEQRADERSKLTLAWNVTYH